MAAEAFYNEVAVTAPSLSSCEVVKIFTAHLEAFIDDEPLRTRVYDVLIALPVEVQRDFLDDPRFRIAKETYVPGKGWTLWMESPGAVGSVSRCVLLRARLGECSTAFAYYVIAHEFAHAFLRNGGWGAITDKEEAADALAASWGFHRPAGGRW
jgi:hypothetical protein